ncbi:LCP family protein [Mycetocola spongiae]|nr:LCP family protein [Mycetocola spongiae]
MFSEERSSVSPAHQRSQQSAAVPGARHGRLRKSSPWLTGIKATAAALAVVMVSGAGVAAYAAWDIVNTAKPSVTLSNTAEVPPIDEIKGGVNLLLVGSDSRQGQDPSFGDPTKETGVLNDVTMLLHISEDHSAASVVSFPRDMFVDVPECVGPDGQKYPAMRSAKINSTLARGGLACTVSTVEKLTNLSIPFAAEVQFNGVIELSNAVGGVEVCVAQEISDRYTGTFLEPGMHNLQGLDALQFLRTRHGVGDGSDLGRISNQQVFLSALVRELKDSATLSDPTKLFSIAKAAVSNMTLSSNLNNINTMVQIALALKAIPLEQVVFVQYPNALGSSGGQSGVLPLKGPADELFAAISGDKPISLSGDTGLGSVKEDPATPGAPTESATQAPATQAPATQAPATPDAGTGTLAPTDGGAVVLPPSVQGQTAGEFTCSAGNAKPKR